MSDDIDIRSGGAIAVDTDTLRRVADEYAGLSTRLEELLTRLDGERGRLLATDVVSDIAWEVIEASRDAGWAIESADRLADRLGRAATIYEIVDLRAQRSAAYLAGDPAAAHAADARLRAIVAEHPFLSAEASALLAAWTISGPVEIASQAPWAPFGAASVSVLGLAIAVQVKARGRVPRNAELTGAPPPVVVDRVKQTTTTGTAPTSLTSVIDRMPEGKAQVRVERYAMADGTQRFAVYVTGTRAVADDREPWNMDSNLKLYDGERSASYEATVQALRDAGAQPGDAVYEFGHSQGGMIASRLALQEGYDVKALVTFGSPISADVGPDTLSVQLRHTDDPVAALADGGNPARVGSAESFIAERVADPAPGIQDAKLAAHQLDEYRETAAMVDASPDLRVNALDSMFGELADAESVEVLEYSATTPGLRAQPPAPGGVTSVSPYRAWGAG